jgi:hypothetical protein
MKKSCLQTRFPFKSTDVDDFNFKKNSLENVKERLNQNDILVQLYIADKTGDKISTKKLLQNENQIVFEICN